MTSHRFLHLNDDSLELLESDYTARVAYLDMLCLLHDLLVPHATKAQHAHFPTQQVFRDLADLVHTFPSERQIGAAARANISATEFLHSVLGRNYSSAQAKTKVKDQTLVDNFLADLLKEYDIIRVIRSRGGVLRSA